MTLAHPLPVIDQPAFAARFDHELRRSTVTILQINIGRICNLACAHCHVESSPARTAPDDNMTRETAEKVVQWALQQPSLKTVDFTGGSPEMNPNFRWMVEQFAGAGLHIISRCNPTILEYRGSDGCDDYSWIPEFYATHHVEIVASLPCYLEENVKKQRGVHAYPDSIAGLQKLNAIGYGQENANGAGSGLELNLVYNPVGPSLPPCQEMLEADYKRELLERWGIVFNSLWTIVNMPIKRWRHELERSGQLESYMDTLATAFNPETVMNLMCRHQVSIGPTGRMHDCDFNQALEMDVVDHTGRFIWDIRLRELADGVIATSDHCYGCTAGAGSSCGGTIA